MSARNGTIVGACILAALIVAVLFSQSDSPQQKPPALDVPWVKTSDSSEPQTQESRTIEELRSNAADRKRRPEERAQAIFRLAKSNDWSSVETLIDQLDDPSPLIRGRAAAAVRHILGTDFYFRAEDPPPKRKTAIDGIRRYWQSRKDNPPGQTNAK